MRHRTLAACLAVCISFAVPALAQTAPQTTTSAGAPAKAHHVVFALTSSDPTDWNLTLGNIRNLTKALEPDSVEVEVVAFGPGIAFLKSDSEVAADIKLAQAAHVRFAACANSMRARNLSPADLISGAEVVPAGIAEVVRKQEAGWIYIKAGR